MKSSYKGQIVLNICHVERVIAVNKYNLRLYYGLCNEEIGKRIYFVERIS